MKESAWSYHEHALGLSDAGELAEALQVCSEGIERFADDEQGVTDLYFQRSIIYDALRQYDAAITDMNQVILHRPSVEDYYFRGRLHYKNKAYAEAVADFTEAIRGKPQSGSFHFNRGRARHHQGDETGAAEDFRQVLVLLRENHPEAKLARQFLEEITSNRDDITD